MICSTATDSFFISSLEETEALNCSLGDRFWKLRPNELRGNIFSISETRLFFFTGSILAQSGCQKEVKLPSPDQSTSKRLTFPFLSNDN